MVATRDMARRKRRRRALATLGIGVVAVVATGYGAWLYIDQQEYLLDERCALKVGDQEHRLDPDQTANAAQLAAVAMDRDLPSTAAAHAISIALQESDLRVDEPEDDGSSEEFFAGGGPEWSPGSDAGSMAVTAQDFFDDLAAALPDEEDENDGEDDGGDQDGGGGAEQAPSHWSPELTAAETADLLGRPHDLSFYEQHEEIGRAFSAPLTGQQPVGMTCHLSQLEAPGADPEGTAEELAAALPSVLEALESEEDSEDPETRPDHGEAIDVSGEGEDDVVVIDLPEPGPEEEDPSTSSAAFETDVDSRLLWLVAHWSVAHAERFGIQGVHAGPYLWDRDTTRWERAADVREDSVALTFSREG